MISDLKGALDSLEGKWGLAVGATLLISVIMITFNFIVDFSFTQILGWEDMKNSMIVDIITTFMVYSLTLGGYYLALHIIREKDAYWAYI